MTEYTKFKENLQYTVLMPGESSAIDLREGSETCKSFVMITGLLAGLLALSTVIVSWSFALNLNMDLTFVSQQTCGLASKLQNGGRKNIIDDFPSNTGYAGRAVMQ